MNAVLLLGAGAGLGVLLVLRSVRPPRRPLAAALRDLEPPVAQVATPNGLGALAHRLADSGVPDPRRAADLELVGRTPQQHALRKLLAAGVLGALAPATVALLILAGVGIAPAAAVLPAAALAAAGYVVPDVELRSLAAEHRTTFVHALSSYLDITAVLLAGGAGVETALHAAARLGDGWPQRRLRAALDRCRLTGRSPWETFADLGDRLAIGELSELATSLQLAGEHGARVRRTLSERARALRAQQLAGVEERARAVTEQMSVPVALLAVAFMLFVGFPAVWVVLGEL